MSLFMRVENNIFSFFPPHAKPISYLAFTRNALEDTGTQKNTWNLVSGCSLPEITTVDGRVGALFKENSGLINADTVFPNIAGDFTIECWVDVFPECTILDGAAPRVIFSKYYYGNSDNRYIIQTYARPGGLMCNDLNWITIQNHTWYHTALTRKGEHVTFWINGKEAGSYDYFRADALTRNVPFTVGINSNTGSSRFFNCSKFYGALSDFKIYNECIYNENFDPFGA